MAKVIHTDNSSFFRNLMRQFLFSKNCEVESFAEGSKALEAAQGGDVSLFITGLSLEDMSGEEYIQKIAAAWPDTPIITVTSNEDEAQIERLKKMGVKACILKSKNWQIALTALLP